MAAAKIRAITFDLWDTLIDDDSDEPKRAARGLAPKPVERRNLVEAFLNEQAAISREEIDLAYNATDEEFRKDWYGKNITWTVGQRLEILLKKLDRSLPMKSFTELVRRHEEMELEVKPDPAPEVASVLKDLQDKYLFGIISDTIFSPGRALKQLLDHYDILRYFSAFVFSDEIGCSKPDPLAFEAAAKGLGVTLNEIVHIGDREEKDIAGAKAVGAKSILCTVIKDRGSDKTAADAIFSDYADLPAILEKLDP